MYPVTVNQSGSFNSAYSSFSSKKTNHGWMIKTHWFHPLPHSLSETVEESFNWVFEI